MYTFLLEKLNLYAFLKGVYFLLLRNSLKFVCNNEKHKICLFYSLFFINGISSYFSILFLATKVNIDSCDDDVESALFQELNKYLLELRTERNTSKLSCWKIDATSFDKSHILLKIIEKYLFFQLHTAYTLLIV